jgi:hypothetical protein
MKFKLIPHYIASSVQFVISISEQNTSESYIVLFEMCKSGFSNVYGTVPPKYGVDLNPNNTHIIIDGVDDL